MLISCEMIHSDTFCELSMGMSHDYHEAIAVIPAPDEALKGKILDCVQTGYTLNDKVIRHAKVVVGE